MNAYQLNLVVKTQRIRLLDVFVLGPLMIYAATLLPEKHKGVGAMLGLFGVTTIAFNWINYKAVEARHPDPPLSLY